MPGQALSLTLRSIVAIPGVVDEQIAIQECLSVTVDFDQDSVDGAQAARGDLRG